MSDREKLELAWREYVIAWRADQAPFKTNHHGFIHGYRAAEQAVRAELSGRVAELEALINSPQTADFLEAVRLEAAHQVERWGTKNDAGKAPTDWFWLLGYLGGKAVWAAAHGDREKALHHTISSAAACLNWHRTLSGNATSMRPGIADPESTEDAHG